jgi:hypothetical protein
MVLPFLDIGQRTSNLRKTVQAPDPNNILLMIFSALKTG